MQQWVSKCNSTSTMGEVLGPMRIGSKKSNQDPGYMEYFLEKMLEWMAHIWGAHNKFSLSQDLHRHSIPFSRNSLLSWLGFHCIIWLTPAKPTRQGWTASVYSPLHPHTSKVSALIQELKRYLKGKEYLTTLYDNHFVCMTRSSLRAVMVFHFFTLNKTCLFLSL